MKTANRKTPKVGFVSLGCPKALVDSERILTRLRAEGYEVAASYRAADLVVVNTCGFIDAAVDESLDAIGEALAENGKVIVTGCLGAQPQKILDRHPQVLKITGPQRYEEVVASVHEHLPPKHEPFLDLVPAQGVKLTPRHYAYLKISEGCNHRCSFCIIPSMRGDLVSRPIGEVLREAEQLVRAGVKEILVISQDTSAYGVDLKYAARALARTPSAALASTISPRPWASSACGFGCTTSIRIRTSIEVVELMADGGVLPYLDIPFQHASARILKLMKRPAAAEDTLQRIAAWRRVVPDITIRSTFIVGFPGETEAGLRPNCSIGCAWRSSTASAASSTRRSRAPRPTRCAKPRSPMRSSESAARASWSLPPRSAPRGSRKRSAARMQVLVDRVEDDVAIARSASDAPEIDGTVRIAGASALKPGDLADVRITGAGAYDLEARLALLIV